MSAEKVKKSLVVGTAGHIDHGKTKLIEALTGIDTDRLVEEKRRGITIDLGFAPIDLEGDVHIGFVDVPGHERFVKNMLAGVGGIDAVLIVVAADESVMPQTREHVEICDLLGIPAAVVALTKIDLADEETIELATLEVSEFLESTAFSGSPIIPVSSVTGEGLDDLRGALSTLADKVIHRSETLLPRIPIDRVFTMKGFGTVITGTLISGRLNIGQTVEIFPSGKKSPIKGLQVHNESVGEARAGHRVAVNIPAVGKTEISRGEVLSLPSSSSSTTILDSQCRMLPSATKELAQNQRVRFHIGSAELIGRVKILSGKEIKPGGVGFARIRLEAPTTALIGDRFVIRRYSPMITIGGGMVLDNQPVATRGTRAGLVSTLQKTANADLEGRCLLFLERQAGPITPDQLTSRFGLLKNEGESVLKSLVDAGQAAILGESPLSVCSSELLEGIASAVLQGLQEAHKHSPFADGIPFDKLKRALPREADEVMFKAILNNLEKEGKIRTWSGLAALRDHTVELSEEEQKIMREMSTIFKEAGTAPPPASKVVSDQASPNAKRIFQLLISRGELMKIADDLFYHRDVLEKVISSLREHVKEESFSVPEFKEWFGISRKYAIPLLEHLDSIGVTYRVGDVRRLHRHNDQ